jgi:hypothetical protein
MKKRKSLTILNHNTYFLTWRRWRYNYRDKLQEKKNEMFWNEREEKNKRNEGEKKMN